MPTTHDRVDPLSDRGSLPLVLLMAIAASGLMAALFANTISAENQVRFDRDFAHALPVADAGIEVALYQLNNDVPLVNAANGTSHDFVTFPVGARTPPQTVDLNGETSTWTIRRVEQEYWEVRSTSTVNGVPRTLVATIEELPLPFMAAFTNDQLNFGGGNVADSYNSATRRWCTNLGVVGSNEAVRFSGEATSGHCANTSGRTVDAVHLFDWARMGRVITGTSAIYPAGSECKKSSGSADHNNCREVVTGAYTYPVPRLVDERLELGTENAVAFIARALDTCRQTAPLTAWTATGQSSPTTLAPAPNAAQAIARGDLTIPGSYHCYDSMHFNRETVLHASATPQNPVIIFVRGTVNVSASGGGNNAITVACTRCPNVVNAGNVLHPDERLQAGRLRIFVLSGDVLLGNHTQFNGVIYAPNSTCTGPNSNAQADIYGAVVCDNLANAGGWRFHYDEALGGLRSGEFAVARWAEEVPDAP